MSADSSAKIPQMPQNLSAQLVCLGPKVLDFNEKKALLGVRIPYVQGYPQMMSFRRVQVLRQKYTAIIALFVILRKQQLGFFQKGKKVFLSTFFKVHNKVEMSTTVSISVYTTNRTIDTKYTKYMNIKQFCATLLLFSFVGKRLPKKAFQQRKIRTLQKNHHHHSAPKVGKQ